MYKTNYVKDKNKPSLICIWAKSLRTSPQFASYCFPVKRLQLVLCAFLNTYCATRRENSTFKKIKSDIWCHGKPRNVETFFMISFSKHIDRRLEKDQKNWRYGTMLQVWRTLLGCSCVSCERGKGRGRYSDDPTSKQRKTWISWKSII